jgi:hypothetical protein
VKLAEEEQVEAWKKAVEQSGDKLPSFSVVRQAAIEIELRDTPLKEIPFKVDDVVRIRVKDNPELIGRNGHVAVVKEVRSLSCLVDTALGERLVHPQYLEDAKLGSEVENKARDLVMRLANLFERRHNDPLVDHLLRYFATKEIVTESEAEVLELLERQRGE